MSETTKIAETAEIRPETSALVDVSATPIESRRSTGPSAQATA